MPDWSKIIEAAGNLLALVAALVSIAVACRDKKER